MFRPVLRPLAYAMFSLTAIVPTLFACGPDFPDSVLTGDAVVLQTPTGNFERELARLCTADVPSFRAQPPKLGYEQQTADSDLADLLAALQLRRISGADRDRLLCDYMTVRDTLNAYRTASATWEESERESRKFE